MDVKKKKKKKVLIKDIIITRLNLVKFIYSMTEQSGCAPWEL